MDQSNSSTTHKKRDIAWLLIRVQLSAVLIFAVIAWVIIPDKFQQAAEKDAVLTSIAQVEHIKQIRTYYSENIVKKVIDEHSGINVSHDHKNKNGTIPIPASFVHDIGDVLKNKIFDLNFYSPYPFSNRDKRVLDDFSNEAWASLSKQPSEPFVKNEEIGDTTIIRVAVADTMSKQLCVSCHNSHPLSTKTDWKLGDLRGILEISKDISEPIKEGRNTGRYLALALVVILGGITLLSYKKNLNLINTWADKLMKRERDLNEAQSIARTGSWTLDINTNDLAWSDEIFKIFGIDKEPTIVNYDLFVGTIHPDDKDNVIKQFEESFTGSHPYDIEHRIIRANDNKVRWVHEKCSHYRDSKGDITYSSGTVQDITERKQYEEKIKQLAMTDQLTGLANRNRFNQRFDEHLKLASRENKQLALLLLDLDNFKNVNDSYGHIVGDKLLQEVAKTFNSNSRETDIIARLGGDEFAIILVHPDDMTAISVYANRIIQAISKPLIIEGNSIQIGTSIGIAIFPNDVNSTNSSNRDDELMKLADIALYKAKDSGRNTLCFYNQELEK